MTADFTTEPTPEARHLRPIRSENADLIDAIIHDEDDLARLTGLVHSAQRER